MIGAGPAGLMAAEVLSAAGLQVTVYDRMPSVGRKLLMAGRGGLNLTHSEPLEAFLPRYGTAAERLAPMIAAFPPSALVSWADGLGQETFVGSSGRVFPKALKASPLLRAWLARLGAQRVEFQLRHEWQGWHEAGHLLFKTPGGDRSVEAEATVLALGGASWPRLGSDGGWVQTLAARGAPVTALRPANVGFTVEWSPLFRDRFAGTPLKALGLSFADHAVRGEAMVTRDGLEGGGLYALSAWLRDAIESDGAATLELDLRPDQSIGQLTARLAAPHAGQSSANHLRKALRLAPVEINLLREAHGVQLPTGSSGALARAIKALRIRLTAVQPIGRAISTAGGVAMSGLDDDLMLINAPGVFVAGEMLDWEAPTGGYLLQASFATGVAAAKGVLKRLA